jgi:hypothetical protein
MRDAQMLLKICEAGFVLFLLVDFSKEFFSFGDVYFVAHDVILMNTNTKSARYFV